MDDQRIHCLLCCDRKEEINDCVRALAQQFEVDVTSEENIVQRTYQRLADMDVLVMPRGIDTSGYGFTKLLGWIKETVPHLKIIVIVGNQHELLTTKEMQADGMVFCAGHRPWPSGKIAGVIRRLAKPKATKST